MLADPFLNRVSGPYMVSLERAIDRLKDYLTPFVPPAPNVDDRFPRFTCSVERNHELSLWDHFLKHGLIEVNARDMQAFLIPLPQEPCELIPSPTAQVRNSPHDLRRPGFDPATVRRNQKA